MSEPFLTEAGKVFRQTLDGEVQRVWGNHLTKEHQAHITFILASASSVYFNSVEKIWFVADQDRLYVKFRGFIDAILREAFDPVNAFVVADSIAEISVGIFNQIKATIDDESEEGPHNELDNDADICCVEREDEEIASNGTSTMTVRLNSPGPDSITFESESEGEMETIFNDENNQGEEQNGDAMIIGDESDKENRPVFSFAIGSDEEDEDMADKTPADEDMAIDTAGDREMAVRIAIDQSTAKDAPAAAWAGLDEEENDAGAVKLEGSKKIKKTFTTPQAVGFDGGVEVDEEGDSLQQAKGTATKKGKGPQKNGAQKNGVQKHGAQKKGRGPQKGPEGKIDPYNNDLYSVVLDENSSWPPKHYKCKIDGCGKQGAWRSHKVHFEHQHAEQWKEATGLEAKEHKCPVAGCRYTHKRSIYITRHLKSVHPEYKAAPAKNGRKNKRC